MHKKICIIGAGIFGLSVYINLKRKKYDCYLIEKKSDILLGASTKNLNRIHFGYHYPRDFETALQSLAGYKSFSKEYKKSIIKNFDNFYAIAKGSRTNFNQYLNFCDKLNLKYKKIDPKSFFYKNQNIEGIIKVKEPIYSWDLLKNDIKSKLNKIRNNKIFLNVKSFKIVHNKKFFKLSSKTIDENFDYIVDASYEGSNNIQRKLFGSIDKFKYQKTCIYEFKFSDKKKFGFCLMDGNFFSFLPHGKKNTLLFYDVEHSILNEEKKFLYNRNWIKHESNTKIKNKIKKIKKKFNNYFPKIDLNFTKKKYISSRVLLANVEKTDKRISIVKKPSKKYFKIISAKVDHSVEIAKQIEKMLK